MKRAEVLAEVERIIAESIFGEDEQPAEAAEKVLSFLDDIGYDAGPELALKSGDDWLKARLDSGQADD
jgi:hypothetical protein